MLQKVISFILLFNTYVSFCDAVVQDFYWRDYVQGVLPYDAIQGCSGRYIGQVNHQGHFLPATIYPHKNVAIAEFSGKRNVDKNIKILCSPETGRFYWESVDFNKQNDRQMKDVVKGGYQENLGINLFIGRINHEGECKIGKVVEIDNVYKGIWVWNQKGETVRAFAFEILKYNSTIIGSDGSIIFEH